MRLSAVSRETKFHIVQLFADYHLSKRTDVYYLLNYQVAAGDGTACPRTIIS
jgi:predicted porin